MRLTESYHLLRTNLFFLAGEKEKTIMVASALPREGKSTVAANLATVCANGHKQVLLVDADFRRPTQHLRFGVDNSSGLTQALRCGRRVTVQQAQPGLDILTSGPLPANPPDELASETMMHLIEFVREQYDLIIFDSPSVLLVTDALILARWVDAILLVVKSSQTRREQVSEAVKQLNRANSNLLGVVLNSVSAKTAPGRRVRAFGRSTEPDVVNFYTAPVC